MLRLRLIISLRISKEFGELLGLRNDPESLIIVLISIPEKRLARFTLE